MARRKKDEQTAELPFEENDNRQSRIVQVSREGFLTPKDFGAKDVVDNPSYLPRGLVLANLPYKKLYKSDGSIETNYVQETEEVTLALWSAAGLPYGKMARLLLAYISEYAVKKKTRKVLLDRSALALLTRLGMSVKTSTVHSLKDTLNALSSMCIHFRWSRELEKGRINSIINYPLFSRCLFWESKRGRKKNIISEESLAYVELSEYFYEQLQNSVPINVEALKKINSPMAIDIYCFVSYQAFRIKKSHFFSWDDLHLQFGAGFSTRRDFVRNFKLRAKEVQEKFPYLSFFEDPQQEGYWITPAIEPELIQSDDG